MPTACLVDPTVCPALLPRLMMLSPVPSVQSGTTSRMDPAQAVPPTASPAVKTQVETKFAARAQPTTSSMMMLQRACLASQLVLPVLLVLQLVCLLSLSVLPVMMDIISRTMYAMLASATVLSAILARFAPHVTKATTLMLPQLLLAKLVTGNAKLAPVTLTAASVKLAMLSNWTLM